MAWLCSDTKYFAGNNGRYDSPLQEQLQEGAKDALELEICRLMSYQVSVEEAMYNAGRLMKEKMSSSKARR